jgi:hypothetical protein
MHKKYLKIFSRTTGPISTRFGTNHPCGEVCSNKGRCTSLRGDNSKRVKIHKEYFKNLLHFQPDLAQIILGGRGFN